MKSFFKDKLLNRPTAVIAVMNIVFCILSCVLAGLMNYSFISIALAALLWLACQALIVYLYRNAREDWLSWVKEHWYIFLVLIIVLARNLLTLAQCWMGIDAAGLYARLGVSCTIFTFYGISTFTEMLVFQDYSFAKLFAVQSLLVGMLFNQFFPLFSIADEPRHITTAYEVSNAMLGIKSPENGMYMRKDDADYYFSFPEYTRDDANNYLAQLAEPLKDGSLVLVEDSAPYNTPDGITAIREKPYPTEMYQYLAPALGITIGRLLKLNTVSTYMLGRLINLIVYTFMITLALHIVPLGKSALYTIALLPMSMQLATSLSRDVFRICIAVMTISLTMYLFYTEIAADHLRHRLGIAGSKHWCDRQSLQGLDGAAGLLAYGVRKHQASDVFAAVQHMDRHPPRRWVELACEQARNLAHLPVGDSGLPRALTAAGGIAILPAYEKAIPFRAPAGRRARRCVMYRVGH